MPNMEAPKDGDKNATKVNKIKVFSIKVSQIIPDGLQHLSEEMLLQMLEMHLKLYLFVESEKEVFWCFFSSS
jgi:hypothetical protein